MLLESDIARPLRETFHPFVASGLVAGQIKVRGVQARINLNNPTVVLQARIQAADLLHTLGAERIVFNRLLVRVRVVRVIDQAFHVLAVLIAHQLAADGHQRIAAGQPEAAGVIDIDSVGAVGRIRVDEIGQRLGHVFLVAAAAAGHHIEVD